MLSHASIWKAIDMLADQHDISPSGLAKLAGLDPTTFNRSKRFKANGKPRWPSTESIAKILDATKVSPDRFFSISAKRSEFHGSRALETKAFAPTGAAFSGQSDIAGLHQDPDIMPYPCDSVALHLQETAPEAIPFSPSSNHEDRLQGDFIAFPASPEDSVFALAICDDALEPLYHCGDILLLSPTASLRSGDRILVKSKAGLLSLYSLIRATAYNLIVHSLQESKIEIILSRQDLQWAARILWASQ
ncbi:MAG: helix-turn-helix transcriptional regulator [Cohaesibacter sp.]|nr:helix-turn-helix transcriptional regulator [Cohaesibacter sp.]